MAPKHHLRLTQHLGKAVTETTLVPLEQGTQWNVVVQSIAGKIVSLILCVWKPGFQIRSHIHYTEVLYEYEILELCCLLIRSYGTVK